MFNAAELSRVVSLQEKTYQLLRWVNEHLRRGSLDFGVVHTATTTSEAAAEWIGRHLDNLPTAMRPRADEVEDFARLFASYLTTSFELKEKPDERLKSGCGCWCPFCTYVVSADNLTVRNPSKKAKQSAVNLKELYIKFLAESLELEASAARLDDCLSTPALAESVSLATYAHELIRRSRFASQGEGILVLWREIAWESGFVNDDPKRPYRRAKKGFKINAEEVLSAERRIVDWLAPPEG